MRLVRSTGTHSQKSDSHAARRGEPVVDYIAGVPCLDRFKQQHFHLLVGHGPMLDAAWNNHEVARTERHGAIARLDAKRASPDKEDIVGLVVLMPDKLAARPD